MGQEAPISKGGLANKKDASKAGTAVNQQDIGAKDGPIKTEVSEKDMSMKVTDTQGHIYESTYQ